MRQRDNDAAARKDRLMGTEAIRGVQGVAFSTQTSDRRKPSTSQKLHPSAGHNCTVPRVAVRLCATTAGSLARIAPARHAYSPSFWPGPVLSPDPRVATIRVPFVSAVAEGVPARAHPPANSHFGQPNMGSRQ